MSKLKYFKIRVKKQKLREELAASIEILQGNMVSLQQEIAKHTMDSKNREISLNSRVKFLNKQKKFCK